MKQFNENEKCCNGRQTKDESHMEDKGMGMRGNQRGKMMMEAMGAMMRRGMKNKMGNEENPMQRCMDMMSQMNKRSEENSYTTDELMDLFKDWCGHVEDEIVTFINSSGEIDEDAIADKFHLSTESVSHLLKNMRKTGKIKFEKDN